MLVLRWALTIVLAVSVGAAARAAEPVRIGLDAEFGLIGSTSAQAIEQGISVAIA